MHACEYDSPLISIQRTRVEACGGGVEAELADGDGHPLHTKVAKTEDTRSVRHNNNLNVVARPVLNNPQVDKGAKTLG